MGEFFFNPELLSPFEASRRSNADMSAARSSLCLIHQPISIRVTDELWRGCTADGAKSIALRFPVATASSSPEESEKTIQDEYLAHKWMKHQSIAKPVESNLCGTQSYAAYQLDEEFNSIEQYSSEQPIGSWGRLKIFVQVLDAFVYAHARGICHGRLDASQVMCAKGKIVVFGFGSKLNSDRVDDVRALGDLLDELINGYGNEWWTASVRRVAEKARSKHAGDRYSEAREMKSDLARAMSLSAHVKARATIVSGAIASILAICVITYFLSQPQDVAVSPDAENIVGLTPISEKRYGDNDMAVYSSYDPSRDLLAWTNADGDLFFSGNGYERSVYRARSSIRSIDLHPERLEVVAACPEFGAVVLSSKGALHRTGWSADRVWYESRGEHIYIEDSATNTLRSIASQTLDEKWTISTKGCQVVSLTGRREGFAIVRRIEAGSYINLIDANGRNFGSTVFKHNAEVSAIDMKDGLWLVGTTEGDVYLSYGDGWVNVSGPSPSYVTHVLLSPDGISAFIIRNTSASLIRTDGQGEEKYLGVMAMQCHDAFWSQDMEKFYIATESRVSEWRIADLH